MMTIDTVLFDLDGTLVEHGHALFPPLLADMGYVRNAVEIKAAVAEEIHHFYDHVLTAEEQGWVPDLYRQLYARVLAQLDIPDADGARARAIHEYFDTHPIPPVFDDAQPLVEQLHRDGWRLGIITQRGRSGAESFLREHGLAEMFPVIVAGDDGHGRKPGPEPFQAATAMLDTLPDRAIYIGDRIDDDCEGAVNAGLRRAFLIDRDRVWVGASAGRDDYVRLDALSDLWDHLPDGPVVKG